MQTRFKHLENAMDWVAELLSSIDAEPERPIINLSQVSGEIAFVYNKRRWKLTIQEEAKPALDAELSKLMEAEAQGRA
jgi:hypothetical protein